MIIWAFSVGLINLPAFSLSFVAFVLSLLYRFRTVFNLPRHLILRSAHTSGKNGEIGFFHSLTKHYLQQLRLTNFDQPFFSGALPPYRRQVFVDLNLDDDDCVIIQTRTTSYVFGFKVCFQPGCTYDYNQCGADMIDTLRCVACTIPVIFMVPQRSDNAALRKQCQGAVRKALVAPGLAALGEFAALATMHTDQCNHRSLTGVSLHPTPNDRRHVNLNNDNLVCMGAMPAVHHESVNTCSRVRALDQIKNGMALGLPDDLAKKTNQASP